MNIVFFSPGSPGSPVSKEHDLHIVGFAYLCFVDNQLGLSIVHCHVKSTENITWDITRQWKIQPLEIGTSWDMNDAIT